MIESIEWCGRKRAGDQEKPRLVKIKLRTQDNRKKILSKAKLLRESPDDYTQKQIYIRPDQTRKQQQDSKNLRDALRQMRLENPEKEYKIYRNQITEVQVNQES